MNYKAMDPKTPILSHRIDYSKSVKMWFVAFFMIAAVFGNPEGWCNISHLMYFYHFTSCKKKKWLTLFYIFSVDCSLPPR